MSLEEAKKRAEQARERAKTALAVYHAAIAEEYQSGIRQVDLVHRTGLTREQIRRILRAAGIKGSR